MNNRTMIKLACVFAVTILPALNQPLWAQYERPANDVDQTANASAAVRAERLYNGVNRPFMIQIAEGEAIGSPQLVLLDSQSRVVSGPIDVRAGRQDLAELMPEVWQLREAVYLQLLQFGRPSGSAVVLQPMLTRMVPVMKRSTRPDGSPYDKIVSWRSEMEPVPVEEPEQPEGGEQNSQDTKTNENNAASAPIPAQHDGSHVFSAGDTRLLTGVRAYSERDVEMITNQGKVLLMMRPDVAPNTVWNFLQLCEGGFYREVVFHRIVPLDRAGRPFVIQAGDPTATGEGGAGYWLPMENSTLPHDFGVISMARADDPDSAGSQFFICLSREGTARLDGQYCSFGTAIDGAETIWKIANVELVDVAAGTPANPPFILETKLIASPPRVPGEARVPVWSKTLQVKEKPDGPTRVPR